MLKKLLVSLLSAFLCISVVAEPESQLNENQNLNDVKIDENGNVFVAPLKYHISSDSTAEVIKDYSYEKLESVVIPSKILVSVTGIVESAFFNCHSLTSIEIPSSVTSIGQSAFMGCSGLASIEIPSRVTDIYVYAFRGCSGLTHIVIPSSVTSIGYEAFYLCENLDVVIDNSKENVTVYEDAFYRCKSVKFLK